MTFRFLPYLGAAVFSLAFSAAHADVVFNNVNPSNPGSSFTSPIIGQSVAIGSASISLRSVVLPQATAPVSGETFTAYSRNSDGTLGSPLFGAFNLSYDSSSLQSTATVAGNSSFTLQANTSYFLVLNSGSTNDTEWDFTLDTTYTSNYGLTLPNTNCSFSTASDGTTSYYSISDGPQLLQINGISLTAVPEPSTCLLIGASVLFLGVTNRQRQRQNLSGKG